MESHNSWDHESTVLLCSFYDVQLLRRHQASSPANLRFGGTLPWGLAWIRCNPCFSNSFKVGEVTHSLWLDNVRKEECGESRHGGCHRARLGTSPSMVGLSLQGEREGFLGWAEQRQNDPRPRVHISSHLLGLCFCIESSKGAYENHTQEVNCRNWDFTVIL